MLCRMGEVKTEVRSGGGCGAEDEEDDDADARSAASCASSSAASVLIRSIFIDAYRVCLPPVSDDGAVCPAIIALTAFTSR